MKKNLQVLVLCAALMVGLLAGCSGSPSSTGESAEEEKSSAGMAGNEGFEGALTELSWEEKYGELTDVDYDAILAALPPLTPEEEAYEVQLGYFDCDHMVAGPIGDITGIYDKLGVRLTATKTGQVSQAMAAGQMDFGYMGTGAGTVTAIRDGSPIKVLNGNHTGGSYYLVVSNEINETSELVGKRLAIGNTPEYSTSWKSIATDVDIPVEGSQYETFAMSDRDELFALQAGQLDAFTCCDPYGSYAEHLGVGRIVATDWGAASGETSGQQAGICCTFVGNTDFIEQYPNLTLRVLYGHVLSIQYMYQHPYTAAEIFSEVYDVPTEVGLRTIYMKGIAEGRTINWELSESNWSNWLHEFERWEIDPEYCPDVTMEDIDIIWRRNEMDEVYKLGVPDFQDFITEKVDPVFHVGMSFEDFMEVAKEIDYID